MSARMVLKLRQWGRAIDGSSGRRFFDRRRKETSATQAALEQFARVSRYELNRFFRRRRK